MKREKFDKICICAFFLTLGVLGASPIHFNNRPIFSFERLLGKEFQSEYENYFAQQIRKRSFFIRSDIVIGYLFFREVAARSGIPVIWGNSDTLFEKNYLNHYYGVGDLKGDTPKLGSKSLEVQMDLLREGYKRLRTMGKTVTLIIYPHKVWLYPEVIPERWKLSEELHRRSADEQSDFFEALDRVGIPWVNGLEIFERLREEGDLLLYPRGSTHWTEAAACRVFQAVFAEGNLGCTVSGSRSPNKDDVDIGHLTGVDNVLGMRRFDDPIPLLIPSSSPKLPKTHMTFVGTSFSAALYQSAKMAGVLGNRSQYTMYYREGSEDLSKLLQSDWIILEQQQGSRFYSNLEKFLLDVGALKP